jgi:hypothetical protein
MAATLARSRSVCAKAARGKPIYLGGLYRRILALIAEQPDRTLDELIAAM